MCASYIGRYDLELQDTCGTFKVVACAQKHIASIASCNGLSSFISVPYVPTGTRRTLSVCLHAKLRRNIIPDLQGVEASLDNFVAIKISEGTWVRGLVILHMSL